MNWLLFQNSLLVAGLTTACATLIGFGVALLAMSVSKPVRHLVSSLAIVSLVLPPFLVTNCWLHLMGATGVWREWLPLNMFSLGGTVWILTLMFWPVAMFFALAAWKKLEPSHFEADTLLRGTRLVRWLLLPSAKSELRLASAVIFILAFNNFTVPAILQVKVLPAELWVSFNTTFDYPSALKLGWPLLVVPVLLLVCAQAKGIEWPRRTTGIGPILFRKQLGFGIGVLSVSVAVLALALGAILPLSQILVSQQTWTAFVPALVAGQSAIIHSFLFAAITACVVIVMAVLLGRTGSSAISWLTFLVPGVVLGIALIYLCNRSFTVAFYQSIGIVIFAFALRYFAPAWNLAAQAFRSSDAELVDAARLEGARGWQLFRHAYLPQMALPLCAGWYATYIFCLWDVETLVLIIPPGRETAAIRIFNLLHYGHNSQVNALCLLLLILAIIPLVLFTGGRSIVRRATPALLVGALGLFTLNGCSVSDGGDGENRYPVESQFFSHVEIIGARGTGLGQFNKPRSLALDRDDNLFVVDMTGRVQKFSPEGRYLLHWQMPQTDLGRPKGMCLDADGNIVLIEPHYSRVNHYASDGTLVAQWGGVRGTNEGQLAFPRSVGINSRGEMYLTEYGITERVQHFSAKGEKFLHSFGEAGARSGRFNRPEGLGLDAQDRVYVADSCNHRIQVFAPDGSFLHSFGKAGSGRGDMSYPYDVRVDAAGFRFVCEFGNSRIQIFNAKNDPVELLGTSGFAPGQFANPWSIAFDSKGNLYVADSQNHRVQKFLRKGGKTLATLRTDG